MKKLSFDTLLFKVAFLFVLFFGGISFEVKAQEVLAEHRDSVKVVFDRAVLDIAKVAAKSLVDVSSANNKEDLKLKIDNYQDFKEFEDNGKAKKDIPSIQPIIKNAKKTGLTISGKDIATDTATIRQIINNFFSEVATISSYKNKLNKDNLNEVFILIIQKATEEAKKTIPIPENSAIKNPELLTKEDVIFTTSQSDSIHKIVEEKIERNNKLVSKNLFPILNDYQEYVLLASLGLGLIILLLVLFTNSSLSTLKNKVRKISSTNKVEVDSSKFVFSHVFDKEKGQLETQIQEMQKTIHQLSNEIERLKVKNDTVNIQKSPVEKTSYFTNPINTNSPTKETKYAKYPSSENGFSSSSLKFQNDDEAIYIISINGNQATFEINQNNFEAMQRAMNDTTSFLSKACEFLDVPQNNKRPHTDTKGTLQLMDNIWHITQKAKIKFV